MELISKRASVLLKSAWTSSNHLRPNLRQSYLFYCPHRPTVGNMLTEARGALLVLPGKHNLTCPWLSWGLLLRQKWPCYELAIVCRLGLSPLISCHLGSVIQSCSKSAVSPTKFNLIAGPSILLWLIGKPISVSTMRINSEARLFRFGSVFCVSQKSSRYEQRSAQGISFFITQTKSLGNPLKMETTGWRPEWCLSLNEIRPFELECSVAPLWNRKREQFKCMTDIDPHCPTRSSQFEGYPGHIINPWILDSFVFVWY